MSSNTVVTKEIIAYSLKFLSKDNDIENISITQIMKETGLRRQTFYDHFDDKYDLLTWILGRELTKEIEPYIINNDLNRMVMNTLTYLDDNKIFYSKILLSDKFDSFNNYFFHYFYQIFEILVVNRNIESISLNEIDRSDIDLIVNFNTAGFTDALKTWLINSPKYTMKDYSEKILKMMNFSL